MPLRPMYRSSHPEVFLGKAVLKICSKFTGEHTCRSVISIKLQSNFIEITLRHGCSPVNLLHIFRATFLKNTSGWLLLCEAFLELRFRISVRNFFLSSYFKENLLLVVSIRFLILTILGCLVNFSIHAKTGLS